MQINERLHEGQSLEQAIAASQRLSGRIQQMIAVGEEAGRVDAMLRHIADIEDAQVNRAVESLSKAMEPLLMVMLGLIIGALMLAMYLPIFQMGAAV
jgi:type IV pilus assembly protein PilC